MSSVAFSSLIPQGLQNNDEIIVKGLIKEGAKTISFNFRIDDNIYPETVALHFKTKFGVTYPDCPVVFNSKNGSWQTEECNEETWQENNSREFHFTFLFLDEAIYIYTQDHNRVFYHIFNHRLPFRDILTFQIWDDLEKVTELTYRFKN